MADAGRLFDCGIRTYTVSEASLDEAMSGLKTGVNPDDVGFLLVFYAPDYDAAALARALAAAFPGVRTAGCSTAGEISSAGLTDGGLVAIAFPRDGFDVVSTLIPDVAGLSVERGSQTVARLRADLARLHPDLRPGQTFAISLIDGLCMREEVVVSAIDWALDDIPLVGGSAGDGMAFRATTLIHDGAAHTDAAILILVRTDHPFRVFKSDNFEPTDRKMVVTASDPALRTVHELNAEIAAYEYATLVGLDPNRLTPFGFASHPMVVRVGGEYFCRSLRSTNADGSLSFFCAIDTGVVLTVAKPVDLVTSVEDALSRLEDDLGSIDWILGFDCILRRLDAQNRQATQQISEIYRRHNVFGFNTYGEQFRSMHLNQTFAGIAIGRKDGPPAVSP